MTASVPDPTSRHGLELKNPGGTGSFGELVRYRFLLRLLVRKEVQVRYQGTVLGMAWSYVKPLVRFFVYFFVIGVGRQHYNARFGFLLDDGFNDHNPRLIR